MPYLPTVCADCRAPLPAEPGPGDPEPSWHQVAELPELTAVITEHQGHARICPGCSYLNRAAIPPEIRAHVIGPRLAAVASTSAAVITSAGSGVEEVVETVFEVPTSLGSVFALEAETSAALACPYQEAQTAVHDAPVKNTDETGWSEKGQKRWLRGAATATVAFFVIPLRRNFAGLKALLGETINGIICSDRWAVYSKLPLERRQVCWATTFKVLFSVVSRVDGRSQYGGFVSRSSFSVAVSSARVCSWDISWASHDEPVSSSPSQRLSAAWLGTTPNTRPEPRCPCPT